MAELTGVGATALAVARVRAHESSRADRLFDDPYAAAFVAALGNAEGRQVERSSALALQVVVRTRYYDDWMRTSTQDGCPQVVVLGAGLDARAFRLTFPPEIRLFELDQPGVLVAKERVLRGVGAAPACHRLAVQVDLREDWRAELLAAGFRPDQPTAWLAEGLLVYLDADAAGAMLSQVTALSAPGSRLACERGGGPTPAGADAITQLWQGGLGGDTRSALEQRGWRVREEDLGERAAAYGRAASRATRSGFLTATHPGTG